ncbi:hypothetical protein I4U23_025351 [Adineta vaga]|nr:hypothetical protein I4U23_025351 [Adineta vaga]
MHKMEIILRSIIFKSMICFGQNIVSYNLPRLCSNATWNPNATTLIEKNDIGDNPVGIFINTNNTIYFADEKNDRVLVWYNSNISLSRTISNGLKEPRGIFATTTGDIYIDNGKDNKIVSKWSVNATSGATVMVVTERCDALFVDLYNNLYCSIEAKHKVLKKSLNFNSSSLVDAAGTGSNGNKPYQLDKPRGIFVDFNFDLYVADSNNNRIQRFSLNNPNGTTVVTGSFTLSDPKGVILDGDSYIYIADTDNHRILGSGPNGFRCLAGCANTDGDKLYQLKKPQSLSFDSYGNIYVTDHDNNRIQKFSLSINSCVYNQIQQNLNTTVLTTTIESIFTTIVTTIQKTSTVAVQSTHAESTLTVSTTSIIPITTSVVFSSIITTTIHPIITPTHPASIVTTTIQKMLTSTVMDSTLLSISTTLEQKQTTSVQTTRIYDITTITHPMTTTDEHLSKMNKESSTLFTASYPTTSITQTESLFKFILPTCPSSSFIGSSCNISSTLCDILQPCQNQGKCITDNTTSDGYFCQCSSGFNGTHCEHDIQPCQPDTCWHNSTCINVSNSDYVCDCANGWTGVHCETMINHCWNVTCQNMGVCRSTLQDYECECLTKSYSGRHCEITGNTLATLQMVSKSFGYVAIIFIVGVFVFVGALDILEHVFHINPTDKYCKKHKQQSRPLKKKVCHPIRFTYIDKVESMPEIT